MKTIVILGTARKDSNTRKAIMELCPFSNYELIDLGSLHIAPYDYSGPAPGDDFLAVANKMASADNIIFATPVYWYTMSTSLKNFFDRLTDLMYTYKSIGKSLKGKNTFLISTGGELDLPEGFEVPFKRTSEYFEMNYQGSFYKKT